MYHQNSCIIKIPTANLWHSTMANSQEVYLGDSNNDRQSEMSAEIVTMYMWKIVLASEYKSDQYRHGPKTGNNYISRTPTDSVEIPTPNSGFSKMTSSIKD